MSEFRMSVQRMSEAVELFKPMLYQLGPHESFVIDCLHNGPVTVIDTLSTEPGHE